MKLRAHISSILAIGFLSGALSGQVQKASLKLPPSAPMYREEAKKMFVASYQAYKDYAFGHDDLNPVTATAKDGRNGWGVTIVDSMSTMYIMGLRELFGEAVDFVGTIDFSQSKTPDTVSVFETTIRYLGGLLSAYELSNKKHPALLSKATQLADKMAFAWVGTNNIPHRFVNFTDNTAVVGTSNIAEAGSLAIEWSTLSKYTRNDTYRDLAERSLRHIANVPPPLPGFAAQGIDPTSGEAIGGYVTWGGGSDSYLEYLIKYPRLTNTNDPLFVDTWKTAVDTSITTLLRTSTIGNHLYLADYDSSQRIRHWSSHLACFHGGNWLYGGRLLNNQTIINYGLQLIDGCWNTYASTATGIGPEIFAFVSPDGNFTNWPDATPEQLEFYNQHGFYPTVAEYYYLRPEVLESNFFAWRVTGNTKYLDRAASALKSFKKHLTSTVAFAGIWDVNDVSQGQINQMQSFWLSETLKYLYLTFDDPNHIHVDDYVFSTEAHLFKAPRGRPSYGSGQPRPHKPFHVHDGPELPAISAAPFIGNHRPKDPIVHR